MTQAHRLIGALVAASALAIGGGVPASAETYSHRDARHDVEAWKQPRPAPGNRGADITRVQIVHSRKAVRFDLGFRSASMVGLTARSTSVLLITPGHRFSDSIVKRRDDVTYALRDTTANTSVACDQSSGRHHHTLWVRIDRSCLANPSWVRASIASGTNNGDGAIRIDNAGSDNWRRSLDRVFSPRVHSSR